MRMLVGLLAILVLSGCATGSSLVTGVKRPPIAVKSVNIYQSPPSKKYEVIGIVKSEAEGMTQQESMDLAVQELKERAALIGANGVILGHIGEKRETSAYFVPYATGGGYVGNATSEKQTMQGQAIYVP